MADKNKVYKWLDEHTDEAVKLLQDLVRIPSVNPYFDDDESLKREGNAQRYLQKYIEDMGFHTELSYPDAQELIEYKDMAGYNGSHTFEDRPNLYGELKGEGGGRSIFLSGHMDVVQTGSKWTHGPFSGDLEGETVYGRGTCDMKGGIAAMTIAVKAIKEAGIRLKGDVKIGTVVDEEAEVWERWR